MVLFGYDITKEVIKIHAIDYFCEKYNISNTELAILLGVKQPQVASWKSGTRNIPKKHKIAMLDIFNIPEEEESILDIKDVNELERAKISLFMENAKLKNYLDEIKEDDEIIEEDILATTLLTLKNNVKLAEAQVEIIELIHQLKDVLLKNILTDKVMSESNYDEKINSVKEIIKKLKKGE